MHASKTKDGFSAERENRYCELRGCAVNLIRGLVLRSHGTVITNAYEIPIEETN